jgi:hypothetical protein
MIIDKSYQKKLIKPLKGSIGITISTYVSELKKNGISIEDPNGLVNEKFIAHFQKLIQTGVIANTSGKNTLDSFGLGIGTNRHLSYWNCSEIIYNESSSHVLSWILDNIMKVVIGVVIAEAIAWLGIKA